MGGRRREEGGEVIMVAVDASKEITDYALEWAVRNVVKAADTLVLVALLPRTAAASRNSTHSGVHHFLACLLKKWGIKLEREGVDEGRFGDREEEEVQKINGACVHMMQQLCSANNVTQVVTHVEIVANAQTGSVAAKAHEFGASWIILDRRLKKEGDECLKQFICNIVLVDHAIPKILRLLNSRSREAAAQTTIFTTSQAASPVSDQFSGIYTVYRRESNSGTPASSLGLDTQSSNTDVSVSGSSVDREDDAFGRTPFVPNYRQLGSFLHRKSDVIRRENKASLPPAPFASRAKSQQLIRVSKFGEEGDELVIDKTRRYSGLLFEKPPKAQTPGRNSVDSLRTTLRRTFKDNNEIEPSKLMVVSNLTDKTVERTSSIRRAMSLSIKQPPTPPPLCSVCKHNTPIFGKPPRKFSYREMEKATDGFSRENFLAEGGYGPVYKGVLPDGQLVAVKQHKMVSAQGASEFCSEVEVLSCAQHRNLVMLVGYCMDKEWLLVYEFACNESLDKHLYGKGSKEVMAWKNRLKVAIGAARGLRYLHEDCRVGCIVHRDLRPNNILLTHDFEAMVGDFGLARWQANGQSAEETRVIGTFGYLAPEYAQTGQITEKADVYAFGVVLLEILSGLRAVDMSRNPGQQYLPDWGRPLLQRKKVVEVMDHRLEGNYTEHEAEFMMHAASLCISQEPQSRPRMSKVLRILEGDIPVDTRSHVQPHPAHTRHDTELGLLLVHERSPRTSRSVSSMKPRFSTDRRMERQGSEARVPTLKDPLVSEDYHTYLQDSLAEFIHKMKRKSDEFGKIDNEGYKTASPIRNITPL